MSERIVQAEGFLRPIRSEQDLPAVAELIEQAFQLQSDPEGQAVLQSLRRRAEAPGSWKRTHHDDFQGFVWECGEKIVGNCSLIPYPQTSPTQYVIANVAVARDFQGRGIARALLRASLGLLPARSRHQVWLQVRSDKLRTIRLYRENGFAYHSSICQFRSNFASLQLTQTRESPKTRLTRRHRQDWPTQNAWLQQAYPSILRWYTGTSFDAFSPNVIFKPSLWAERNTLSHCAWRDDEHPLAFLSSQILSATQSRLFLACPQTEASTTIIPFFLQSYLTQAWQGQFFSLEFPAGSISQAIAQSGFDLLRQLDWMRYEGSPES